MNGVTGISKYGGRAWLTDLYNDLNSKHRREEIVKYLQHLTDRHTHKQTN